MEIGPAYATRMYERYGGSFQTQPLTADEQKYDDTCRAIDKLEAAIGEKSLALFTAHEFMWFTYYVNKLHVFPKQPKLDKQLDDLQNLLTALDARQPLKPDN